MQNLQTVTDNFIAQMSSPLSTQEDINGALQECYKYLPESNEEEVKTFMKQVFDLHKLPDLERASIATIICGFLIERGFPSESILEPLINLYNDLLDRSRIFYEMFYAEIRLIDEMDEDRDNKINKIFSGLVSDRDVISQDAYNAIVSLDKFYACAISVFSVNKENHAKAKAILKDKVAFVNQYNQGCYWINRLFTVLFDEPIVVIDIDNKIGFTGQMSGIVDNYQLQHLLMSIPFMNGGTPALSDKDLPIVDGTGEQMAEHSIESKWNMYNLELTEQSGWQKIINNKENLSLAKGFSSYWIWGEGIPADISVHDGHRVILLGLRSYARSSRAQRTFKNLQASIDVEKVLTEEEINNWINL